MSKVNPRPKDPPHPNVTDGDKTFLSKFKAWLFDKLKTAGFSVSYKNETTEKLMKSVEDVFTILPQTPSAPMYPAGFVEWTALSGWNLCGDKWGHAWVSDMLPTHQLYTVYQEYLKTKGGE